MNSREPYFYSAGLQTWNLIFRLETSTNYYKNKNFIAMKVAWVNLSAQSMAAWCTGIVRSDKFEKIPISTCLQEIAYFSHSWLTWFTKTQIGKNKWRGQNTLLTSHTSSWSVPSLTIDGWSERPFPKNLSDLLKGFVLKTFQFLFLHNQAICQYDLSSYWMFNSLSEVASQATSP